MNFLNALSTALTDAILTPMAAWPPIVTLCLLSVIIGVVMAIVFRYTSRQKALRRVADLTRAQVLAIKLFKDDLPTMFTSLGRLLYYTTLRLWHSLPPALVMFIPFILILTQLARWYEYRPLTPGDKAIVRVELSEKAWPHVETLKLTPADGIALGPRHIDPEEPIASWNIRAIDAVPSSVTWAIGDATGEKRVAVTEDLSAPCAVDRQQPGPDFFDRILNPGEPAFGVDSPIQSITILPIDPHRRTPLFGLNIPWWLTLLIISMATAFVVKPLVGVQF